MLNLRIAVVIAAFLAALPVAGLASDVVSMFDTEPSSYTAGNRFAFSVPLVDAEGEVDAHVVCYGPDATITITLPDGSIVSDDIRGFGGGSVSIALPEVELFHTLPNVPRERVVTVDSGPVQVGCALVVYDSFEGKSSFATALLPVNAAATDFIVNTAAGDDGGASFFTVVNPQDEEVDFSFTRYPSDVEELIRLQAGEALLITLAGGDLSGSTVTSASPVMVYAGSGRSGDGTTDPVLTPQRPFSEWERIHFLLEETATVVSRATGDLLATCWQRGETTTTDLQPITSGVPLTFTSGRRGDVCVLAVSGGVDFQLSVRGLRSSGSITGSGDATLSWLPSAADLDELGDTIYVIPEDDFGILGARTVRFMSTCNDFVAIGSDDPSITWRVNVETTPMPLGGYALMEVVSLTDDLGRVVAMDRFQDWIVFAEDHRASFEAWVTYFSKPVAEENTAMSFRLAGIGTGPRSPFWDLEYNWLREICTGTPFLRQLLVFDDTPRCGQYVLFQETDPSVYLGGDPVLYPPAYDGGAPPPTVPFGITPSGVVSRLWTFEDCNSGSEPLYEQVWRHSP